MKDFRYKTIFASSVTKISGEELDKYVSLAGLEKLKDLMPKDVNLGESPDLIGIVLNAAVAGRVNANDDGITIQTGVKIASKFIRRYCNSNHSRLRCLGVIVNAGFSKFGSNEILTEEQAKESKDPINISLAVVLWKPVLNDDFIDLIENSADPTSADYGRLSASWELFFNNYDIYVGGKNISESQKVEDPKEKEEYDKLLRANGGSGKTKDGKKVYRVIKAETEEDWLLPTGIGLVETPAAEVKGLEIVDASQAVEDKDNILASLFIKANSLFLDFVQTNDLSFKMATSLVKECPIEEKDTIRDFIGKMDKILKNGKKEQNLSLSSQNTVTTTESTIKDMKITKLAEITDEVLKTCQASDVTSFFESELEKANEKFIAEQKEKESAATKLTEVEKELNSVKEQLAQINAENEAKKAQDLFNGRMAFLDEKYELTNEDREIIVAQLKKITSEDEWNTYSKQSEVLLKEKSKAYKAELAQKAKELEDKSKLKQSNASQTPPDGQTAVDDALKNGQAANTPPPNTNGGERDFLAEFNEAFKMEDIVEVKKI